MKKLIAALFAALVLAAPAHAQMLRGSAPFMRPAFGAHRILLAQADAPPAAAASDPLALAQAAVAAIPSGKWAGKLDLTSDFALGGWQSLKSTDEAYGVSKRVWHLDKGGQTLLNVGLFAGVVKPLVPLASSSPTFLGGVTVAVPGSALDWALGTKWGDLWVPKAKTGLLVAYDLSRPSALSWDRCFAGFGISYPLGQN